MALGHLVFPLLVLSVVNAGNVPAFLWGNLAQPSLKLYPLSTISTSDFNKILTNELVKKPFLVVFEEETLSVEDLSRKDSDGDTSFPYLHENIPKALYIPSVVDPLDSLTKLTDPEKVNYVKLTENGLSADIENEDSDVLFISLKDAREGESRSEFLKRHDDFMDEIFTKLRERYGNVVAVYTARNPSWTVSESHLRVRRQASANATMIGTDLSVSGLRMYYLNLELSTGNTTIELNNMINSGSSINNTAMNVTLSFNQAQLVLNFYQAAGYWFFESIDLTQTSPAVTETLYPQLEVYALSDFSYRCAQEVRFSSVNDTIEYTVTFVDLKIQPFFRETNTTVEFGDSFNCVGFFSVAIWSGLFVVFILLSITFYGIMMMMDIRTMDRFDDPKGKTITINASE